MSKTARTAAKPNIYQIVTDRIGAEDSAPPAGHSDPGHLDQTPAPIKVESYGKSYPLATGCARPRSSGLLSITIGIPSFSAIDTS
jgi:hypothetical protein